MHDLVLEHREHALPAAQHGVRVVLDGRRLERLENRVVGRARVALHLSSRRPVVDRRLVGRLLVARVDAAREQHLEIVVQPGVAEPLLEEAIHGERRDVAFVEDDRVT